MNLLGSLPFPSKLLEGLDSPSGRQRAQDWLENFRNLCSQTDDAAVIHRELFAALRPLLIARAPGEPGVRLVVLVRELEATHRTLAIECEGALRRRAMKPAPAL